MKKLITLFLVILTLSALFIPTFALAAKSDSTVNIICPSCSAVATKTYYYSKQLFIRDETKTMDGPAGYGVYIHFYEKVPTTISCKSCGYEKDGEYYYWTPWELMGYL